jgi:hypothetical protein
MSRHTDAPDLMGVPCRPTVPPEKNSSRSARNWLKGQYSGPADALVHSYGGNIAASFAVYFLAKRVTARSNFPRASAAALAFMVVQLFEVFDGFGLMTNVYDRLDLAANAVGIVVAITLDAVVKRMSGVRSTRLE